MSDGDGVKRVKSREFTGISPLQLAGTGVKLVKTRVVFVGLSPFTNKIYIYIYIYTKTPQTVDCFCPNRLHQ